MFQVFFFIISCKILCKFHFNLVFYNFTKMKIKSFECPKSIRNLKKIMLGTSDAWSFVPATYRIILKIVGFLYINAFIGDYYCDNCWMQEVFYKIFLHFILTFSFCGLWISFCCILFCLQNYNQIWNCCQWSFIVL